MKADHLPSIAILGGTGKLGPGLALRLAKAGYPVLIGSRQAEKAARVAGEVNDLLGEEQIQGFENSKAVSRAEICLLTVKYTAHEPALMGLKSALQGKTLIDATARVDFRDPAPPEQPSAPRIAQEILGPGVTVVGAFQTVPAHVLVEAPSGPLDLDVLVCADDLEAARETIQIVEQVGLNAYYVGGLDNAIVVEGLTALLIHMNRFYASTDGSLRITGVKG
jgi:NADPH-dependent F420 reductase